MKFLQKQLSYALIFTGLLSALSWLKINFIIGSGISSFSLGHCLSPLIGIFGGTVGVAMLLAFRTLIKFSTAHAFNSIVLACHIPSFCAGLYLATFNNRRTIGIFQVAFIIFLLLSCIALFCAHPVGSQAAAYSLLWLIPLATALIPHKSLWLNALGSTFTAHAVGSVIWLYLELVPTPEAWIALIPVALLERFVFSFGMIVCYHALNHAHKVFYSGTNKTTIQHTTQA